MAIQTIDYYSMISSDELVDLLETFSIPVDGSINKIDAVDGIVVVGLTNGKISLFDDRANNKIGYFQLGNGVIRDLKINSHDNHIVAGAYGDKIAIFDIKLQEVVNSCFGHNVRSKGRYNVTIMASQW